MRDLKTDLELCNKATPGPWSEQTFTCGIARRHEIFDERGECVCTLIDKQINSSFIAQAREGWPHAIERAIEAEALARKLLDVLGRVIPRYLVGRLELDLDSVLEANGLLKKAKEVPGDE